MLTLQGKLYAESPLYRGNARKTLFTRDGDGTQRLVSLAGEIQGTAQGLMDAFIGQSRDGKNIGLLDQSWRRLYGSPMPQGLITAVTCQLRKESYPAGNFFDLRMGVRLDEDRWAVEANANYKYETLFRNSVFDFSLAVNEKILEQGDNQSRLYYLLRELQEGRFWFGAGKSKGMGRVRLDMALPFSAPAAAPGPRPAANHLRISLTFNAANPVLVGWNWGKVDPEQPSFAAVEGRSLINAIRDLPEPIRKRLEMGLGGPILSPEDWKRKFAEYLPRVIAIWLRERSTGETEVWTIPAKAFGKLTKGKHALGQKVIEAAQPLLDQPFPGREAAETALKTALGDKAHMAKRIIEIMESTRQASHSLDMAAWTEIANSLGLDAGASDRLAAHLADEGGLTKALAELCKPALPRLFEQVDQQVRLLQSDSWVDGEIANREEHLRIKMMIQEGKITEEQWGDRSRTPGGVSAAGWREFLDSHARVRFQHLAHGGNLRKSITNDQNFIAFLQSYRESARQELAQPYNIDFRAGGPAGRDVSRKYGRPYDTVFMRMLSWSASSSGQGMWEVYIPGSTLKGAFRKRASQVLKTLWGDSPKTQQVLVRLFGAQGKRGLVFFSDAYLADPINPERAWCSMDGVRMDPKTGKPVETAKADYLFAYGFQLAFTLQLDLQDLGDADLEAFAVLTHLLRDFQNGDIPLGGEKTSGFGWVNAEVTRLTWLTAAADGIAQKLLGKQEWTAEGFWQKMELTGKAAVAALQAASPLASADTKTAPEPPRTQAGYVSHRQFGGYCGMLAVEAEVLTPLHFAESGQPSHTAMLGDGPVNGWDFFSMSSPEAAKRPAQRVYAIPSKSLRGMLRHIYSLASDSKDGSPNIAQLNPVDSLFGWVGPGPNQSIMGRLSIGFGLFDAPQLAWHKTPYPYGSWQFADGQWTNKPGGSARAHTIANTWRIFPHTPLAPGVQQLADFRPDSAQARYFRAILPGVSARFTVRFWNLSETELRRLIWCITLEDGLAHKLGGHRYLGFGSVRLRLLPGSHLIDWASRYADRPDWQKPLQAEQWLDTRTILHYAALRQALDARRL